MPSIRNEITPIAPSLSQPPRRSTAITAPSTQPELHETEGAYPRHDSSRQSSLNPNLVFPDSTGPSPITVLRCHMRLQPASSRRASTGQSRGDSAASLRSPSARDRAVLPKSPHVASAPRRSLECFSQQPITTSHKSVLLASELSTSRPKARPRAWRAPRPVPVVSGYHSHC